MTMQKSESIEIDASSERVWSIAAGEFEHIDRWASTVTRSEALRTGDGPAAGRVCSTPQGKTTETLLEFDEAQRAFTYAITGDAMPGFVARATNRWTIEPLGPDRSRLTMTVEMETRGVAGFVMGPMMRLGMGKLLRTNLEELKHYIETGEQHERTRKSRR